MPGVKMITLDEVIRTFIRYNGSRQGLCADYGTVFDGYLSHYSGKLRISSMLESHHHPNTLAIRYQ